MTPLLGQSSHPVRTWARHCRTRLHYTAPQVSEYVSIRSSARPDYRDLSHRAGRGILRHDDVSKLPGVFATEDNPMDHQAFDRLTRLVGTAVSRRTAWRAILWAALFGVTTRSAAAQRCPHSKHRCGGECCPGKCFRDELNPSNPSCEVCCTKENNNVICGTPEGPVCCGNNDPRVDPCAVLAARGTCPTPSTSAGRDLCVEFISGSYRRR